MGYHKKSIQKGTLGEVSKIKEELEELEDALSQNNKILSLCELADLYGSIEWFLKYNFPDISMKDLAKMATATKEAFEDGTRTSS